MSEQKYYVKLRLEVMYYSGYGFGGIQYLEPYLNDSGDFAPATDRDSFAKSELAEIMNGDLYKQSDCLPFEWLYSHEQLRNDLGWEYNETIDKWEWINPLIELVPVEEV